MAHFKLTNILQRTPEFTEKDSFCPYFDPQSISFVNVHFGFSLATAFGKGNAKQLLHLNISKIIKNVLKNSEALNITLFLWDLKKEINHQLLYFYYLSG